jgi:hypothetical protein
MAFGCGVCVCGLGVMYVGCGWGNKLVLNWVGLFKELRFNSPTHDWFCKKNYTMVRQIYDWKN